MIVSPIRCLHNLAVEQDHDLASTSPLCRRENWIYLQALWDISRIMIDLFIDSFDKTPRELILDFDSKIFPICT